MDPALAFRGFVLGFTIAAAVGPISLLVIRRTLAEGRLYGLVSGLGVATADATYGAIAAFGLGALTDALVNARQVLGLAGGAFLLWLAWQTIRSAPTEAATATTRRRGYAGAYLSILGRGVISVLLAAVLVTALLLVTFDLDRPTRGLITVPDTPLTNVR